MNLASLSEPEVLVLDQLVLGKSNLEIAAHIKRSEKTVKAHVTSIMQKLGLPSRHKVIAQYYIQQRDAV